MGRPVVHWEFWSEDPGKIAEFYEKVFDWNTRSLPNMDYRLVDTGGEAGINGGIMKPKPAPGRASWRSISTLMTSTSSISGSGTRAAGSW